MISGGFARFPVALLCATIVMVLLAGCGSSETLPTQTPVQATATPNPPTAQPAQGESAYRDKVASWGVRMGTALNKWKDLDTNPDPANTDWQNNLVSTISSIQTMSAEPQTWDTPPKFSAVQEKILSAADHYNKGMATYAQGITNADAATIQAGRDEVEKGNADIQGASSLIDTLQP